jgi:hypothetical protein
MARTRRPRERLLLQLSIISPKRIFGVFILFTFLEMSGIPIGLKVLLADRTCLYGLAFCLSFWHLAHKEKGRAAIQVRGRKKVVLNVPPTCDKSTSQRNEVWLLDEIDYKKIIILDC